MNIGRGRYLVDWGHLALLGVLFAAAAWYLLDARSVSLSPNNLLLVQPTALFALGLILFIVPQCFRTAEQVAADVPDAPAEATGRNEVARMIAVAAALGLFVFLLDVLGFDIAMLLFVAATMFICGERRLLPLLIYPLAVTFILVAGFRLIMSYPMHTLVL